MSPGNVCHRGTNNLTRKYVGPTVLRGLSLRKVSLSSIPQQQVARERYLQRQVAGESPEISLGNVVNVVVNPVLILQYFPHVLENHGKDHAPSS
uniref:Uncharacterized protein n=1 Tax=Tanacetum cinerariifolium TaxID=118510 RepID=A0A6L2N2X1_TANCI|nr:hypothetical protein [Tanacetum cinerariifolium]